MFLELQTSVEMLKISLLTRKESREISQDPFKILNVGSLILQPRIVSVHRF